MNKLSIKLFSIVTCTVLFAFISACSDEVPDVAVNRAADEASVDSQIVESKAELGDSLDSVSVDSASILEEKSTSGPVTEFSSDAEEGQSDYAEENSYGDQSYDTAADAVLIDPTPTEGVVRWQAPQNRNYASAKITVSNENGETAVRNFEAGEAIELYGELPDGVYKWKSVITPEVDPSVRAQMRAVRASGDINAERELAADLRAQGSLPTEQEARDNVQFGNFIILNGIVNPTPVDEPEIAE